MGNDTKPEDDTVPGLTQVDGVITIGPKASKFSQDKAAKEADENAQRVIEGINAETEKLENETYIEGDESSPGTLPDKD